MNLFPIPVISIDFKNKALVLDKTGKCMFGGYTMTIHDAAKLASKNERPCNGWKYWLTASHGDLKTHMNQFVSEKNEDEEKIDDDELTPAEWIWKIRERLRPYFSNVVDMRTTAIDFKDPLARMAVLFSDAKDGEIFVKFLTRQVTLFNSQVGIFCRASMEVKQSSKYVILKIEKGESRYGPKVFTREIVLNAAEKLWSEGGMQASFRCIPFKVFNKFFNIEQETPYFICLMYWNLEKSNYKFEKKTLTKNGEEHPYGERWKRDVEKMKEIAQSFELRPQVHLKGENTMQGSIEFLVDSNLEINASF